MVRSASALFALIVLIGPNAANGQQAPAPPFAQSQRATFGLQPQPGAGPAFLIESAGGFAGSLLGWAVIYKTANDCDVEDTGCIIRSAAVGIAISAVTAPAGTYFAGKAGDTNPSLLGASLGAVAGAVAGIGVWHLWTEELSIGNGTLTGILTYSITQGLVTAAGSRLARALQ
jgi:hypothetical protein